MQRTRHRATASVRPAGGAARRVLAACVLAAVSLPVCGAENRKRGEETVTHQHRTYYVDASRGRDGNDGLTPGSPWQTLHGVSSAPLRPGDTLLFRRGEVWRGQLVPQSGREGAPITYGAYGEGAKPLLLGSESRNEPGDWHHEGGNVWATAPVEFTPGAVVRDLSRLPWSLHRENGADAAVSKAGQDGAPPAYRIDCRHSGKRNNHIQFYIGHLAIQRGRYYGLSFRARCTRPFTIAAIVLMRQARPWTRYGSARPSSARIGTEWADYSVRFQAHRTAADARITLFLGGGLPAGSSLFLQPSPLRDLECNQAIPLDVDVGNVIFDGGASTGVKKWRPEDLTRQGDFSYDGATWQVRLCSDGNPAERHKSIELALTRHIVPQGGKSYVTYENLALRCGAAHGFGGHATHHVVIRDCALSYIGGGHQCTRADGKPVRYGNAIEFWSDAHDNLVERCRIWEVYDAALTNQGSGTNVQRNITYRHNVIWNCEYSFEYWNRDAGSRTENIRFVHNTCINAGFGWGHGQRPDPNGRHLMFYSNTAKTKGFVVQNNVFYSATGSSLRLHGIDWSAGLTMDHNCWFQPKGALVLWLRQTFGPEQFAAYQQHTGMDAHSIVADPRFLNAAQGDFRLAPDSPARSLSTKGGPVGALP